MIIEINAVLQRMLTTIREDGWHPNGWKLTPPYCLRAAATQAVAHTYSGADLRHEAYKKTLQHLSQTIYNKPQLGLITYWEQDEKRTQTDIEAVLVKAIESLKVAA